MRLIDADKIKQSVTNEMLKAELNSPVYCTLECVIADIDNQPTAYDVDKVVERLENCPDSTTFRYDKETGVLYEVEADVWARIADGTEVVIPIKYGGIE